MKPLSIQQFLGELVRHGGVRIDAWPAAEPLEDYGLRVDGDRVVPMADYEPLRADSIRGALSRRATDWLVTLEVHPVIGSTNVELMERARRTSVAGTLCTAELQVQGRGRRGRSWSSPFGASLAMSMGFALARRPAELGGLSLVVGLAVIDALEGAGVPGLAVKWPNDLLRDGAKLGGILIELSHQRGTEVVVGIGLNVVLPARVRAALPEIVADLGGVDRPPRSRLLAAIASSVVDFVAEFDSRGFEPFIEPFNARHHYHGQQCQVLLGQTRVLGRVTGVAAGGELLLDGDDGVRAFNGGEVSLRPRA